MTRLMRQLIAETTLSTRPKENLSSWRIKKVPLNLVGMVSAVKVNG
nr:hypothetical protein [Candidatus Freyrarchaeum guaymaensis]